VKCEAVGIPSAAGRYVQADTDLSKDRRPSASADGKGPEGGELADEVKAARR